MQLVVSSFLPRSRQQGIGQIGTQRRGHEDCKRGSDSRSLAAEPKNAAHLAHPPESQVLISEEGSIPSYGHGRSLAVCWPSTPFPICSVELWFPSFQEEHGICSLIDLPVNPSLAMCYV